MDTVADGLIALVTLLSLWFGGTAVGEWKRETNERERKVLSGITGFCGALGIAGLVVLVIR